MEYEIMYKKFKVTRLFDEFPRIIRIDLTDSILYSGILLSESPFGNCQTFSISYASNLRHLNSEEVIHFFKIAYKLFKKKQFIIDVKDEYNKDVLKSIEIVTKEKHSIPYVSTNGSNMNLNLIQLNTSKL